MEAGEGERTGGNRAQRVEEGCQTGEESAGVGKKREEGQHRRGGIQNPQPASCLGFISHPRTDAPNCSSSQ